MPANLPLSERPYVWLEPCRWRRDGHKHKWTIGPCPSCQTYEIPVLVSENACYHHVECDGCEAYRDHQA